MVFAMGASEALVQACGSKFLVNSRSSVALMRVKANTDPTSLLVYWQQDDETKDEDKWSDNATKFLEEVGHTVTVTFDADTFLAATRDSDFKVLMVSVDEARRLKADIEAASSDAVILPMLFTPTRTERRAAEKEFDRYLSLPTRVDEFLDGINKAGKVD